MCKSTHFLHINTRYMWTNVKHCTHVTIAPLHIVKNIRLNRHDILASDARAVCPYGHPNRQGFFGWRRLVGGIGACERA